MGLLDRAGARLTARPEDAEILVVNTCSFIDTAKQESVDTILEMARLKTQGRAKKLIVAGCLVERYRDEIQKNIPEVDAVVGTGELESILEAAGLNSAPEPAPLSPFTHPHERPRRNSTRQRIPIRHAQIFRIISLLKKGRRRPRALRPLPSRRLGRRFVRTAHLSLRRNHSTPAIDAPRLGLHQDRRGLRPPLHLLRHSQSARQIPFPPLRIRRRRSRAARRPRRSRNHPHRPGHHLLRRRPRPPRRPRHPPRHPRPHPEPQAGSASSTPIPTASPANCSTPSRATTTSANTSTSRSSTLLPMSSSA